MGAINFQRLREPPLQSQQLFVEGVDNLRDCVLENLGRL